jgi:hypothetical protein
MTVIQQRQYSPRCLSQIPRHLSQLPEKASRTASAAGIQGRFSLSQPLRPGVSELDPRWFRPYPSQD